MENLLTVKRLEAVRQNDQGELLNDGGGLRGKVRLRRGEVVVSFEYRYRGESNKSRTLSCGTWPDVSLAEIRKVRNAYRSQVSSGGDPAEDARRAREEQALEQSLRLERAKLQAEQEAQRLREERERLASEAAALAARKTVTDLFEHWFAIDLQKHKDKGAGVRRIFEKDVLPLIGKLAVEDVRKSHIMLVVDSLLRRDVPRMAKQVFSLMRQMFRFAVDRDILEADPSAAIRKAKIGGKDTERDRTLTEDEIRALHHKMPSAGLLPTSECAVWIALATCCRIGELLSARWENVDFERRVWRIPAENSKNGRPHTIALSDFALAQFERLRLFHGISAWCYPNRDGSGAVTSKTITKQLSDRQREAAPMSRRSAATATLKLSGGYWTPHDLRRTGASLMTALGVIPEVAERCLNHMEENKVKRTYQRYSYEAEMREAWRLLGERLALLTNDAAENVVTLTRAA